MSYQLEQAQIEYQKLQGRYDELANAFAKAEARIDWLETVVVDLWVPLDERGFKCEPRMDGAHLSVCGSFGPDNCPLCIARKLSEE